MKISILSAGLAVALGAAGCSRPYPEPDPENSFTVQVDDQTFNREVVEQPGLVLVDFYATWCGPCRQVAPVLEDLAREYEGRVKIAKVDIDKSPDLARQFEIESIPTFYAFQDGKIVDGARGAKSRSFFVSLFEEYLAPEAPDAPDAG